MSTHYEIRCTIHGAELPLAEAIYPVTFDSTRPARQFPTRGGARNYIHKYGITHARIVRVSSANQSVKP